MSDVDHLIVYTTIFCKWCFWIFGFLDVCAFVLLSFFLIHFSFLPESILA